MICSEITLLIEMNFSHPFKKYVIEQSKKRSEYQAAGNEIGASVCKCLVNSLYGSILYNQMNAIRTEICDLTAAKKRFANPRFVEGKSNLIKHNHLCSRSSHWSAG